MLNLSSNENCYNLSRIFYRLFSTFYIFFNAIFNIFPQNKVLVELWFLSICFIRTLGKWIFLFSVMHSFSPDMKKSFHTFSLFFLYISTLNHFLLFYFELVFMDYCVFNTPFFLKLRTVFINWNLVSVYISVKIIIWVFFHKRCKGVKIFFNTFWPPPRFFFSFGLCLSKYN